MTVDTTKVALLFAGQGDSTFANTAELLNDYFGIEADTDADYDGDTVEFGKVFFLLTEEKPSKGLDSLFDWADWLGLDYDLLVPTNFKENRYNKSYFKYARDIIDADDAAIEAGVFLEEIQEEGVMTPLVVFAWGDEPSEADFDLLEEVTSREVKAVDITAGLDDLILQPEAEPEPEPEPEPEKPARRSRAKKDPEPEPERAKPARRTRAKNTPSPSRIEEEIVSALDKGAEEEAENNARVEESLKALETGETTGVVMKRVNKANLLAAFDNMRNLVVALVEALPDDMEFELNVPYTVPPAPQIEVETPAKEEKPAEPVKRGRGRPRNPEPKPVKEYSTDDGGWVRAGRGRPPAGVDVRWVNPETGEEVDAPA